MFPRSKDNRKFGKSEIKGGHDHRDDGKKRSDLGKKERGSLSEVAQKEKKNLE